MVLFIVSISAMMILIPKTNAVTLSGIDYAPSDLDYTTVTPVIRNVSINSTVDNATVFTWSFSINDNIDFISYALDMNGVDYDFVAMLIYTDTGVGGDYFYISHEDWAVQPNGSLVKPSPLTYTRVTDALQTTYDISYFSLAYNKYVYDLHLVIILGSPNLDFSDFYTNENNNIKVGLTEYTYRYINNDLSSPSSSHNFEKEYAILTDTYNNLVADYNTLLLTYNDLVDTYNSLQLVIDEKDVIITSKNTTINNLLNEIDFIENQLSDKAVVIANLQSQIDALQAGGPRDSEVVTNFFGSTLGAIGSFFLFLFTEIEIFGVNLAMVLSLLLGLGLTIYLLRIFL